MIIGANMTQKRQIEKILTTECANRRATMEGGGIFLCGRRRRQTPPRFSLPSFTFDRRIKEIFSFIQSTNVNTKCEIQSLS
jgi:hypothetical protein